MNVRTNHKNGDVFGYKHQSPVANLKIENKARCSGSIVASVVYVRIISTVPRWAPVPGITDKPRQRRECNTTESLRESNCRWILKYFYEFNYSTVNITFASYLKAIEVAVFSFSCRSLCKCVQRTGITILYGLYLWVFNTNASLWLALGSWQRR